ncbi:uncharacterized protein LOC136033657 [Artemia franciscana]|uniref:uncharacterized protein LOC136033657 n=1 Tax=Artemia franciscana TaxID=6661 RepID=UPI0032D9F48C
MGNTGLCGNSWAYVAASSLEYYSCKMNLSETIPLSRQQIIDCDASIYGCEGGSYVASWQWIINNGGLCNQMDYLNEKNCSVDCLKPVIASYKRLSNFKDDQSGFAARSCFHRNAWLRKFLVLLFRNIYRQ